MTLTDYIENLYEPALDCGISIKTFWNSSLGEISDYMESYHRKMWNKKKEEILQQFMLAQIIAERHPLTDKKFQKLSMPWNFYPALFKDEQAEYEQEQERSELEEYKAKRRRAMQQFNKMRGGEAD